MLSSPYLSVLPYALVSIRSRLFSFFCTRRYPSLSRLPHSLSLSDLSTYDSLHLPASFTREDPLVRLCHCFHYLLLFLLLFFNIEPSSRQRPGDSSLDQGAFLAQSWCSSLERKSGAWSVQRALEDRLRMVKRWEAPGQPSPTVLRARVRPWIMQNFLRIPVRYSWNATLKMPATGVSQQQFLSASLLQSEKLHSSIVLIHRWFFINSAIPNNPENVFAILNSLL